MAVTAAAGAYMQAEQQRVQQQGQANAAKAQAQAAANNAIAMQQQADVELQKGQVEKRRIDMERDKISRAYQQQAAGNRSLLASGNVDITSGSAADSLLGNAMLFGEDMAANRYNFALADWQAEENARQARWQSDVYGSQAQGYNSQASWLSKSSGSLGNSLLSAGIAGVTSFAGSYLTGGLGGIGGGLGGAAMKTTEITPYMTQYGRGGGILNPVR